AIREPPNWAQPKQQSKDPNEERAKGGRFTPIGSASHERSRFFWQGDGYPRPVRGIRKINPRFPLRGNRNCADRSAEAALLQAAQYIFHVRNRNELVFPL